jgi:transposase
VVHASVEERHRSREFVGFLQKLDAAYPSSTAIELILDNHPARISKETKAWLDAQPEGRFTFVFTPKHGSWLNLVEGFFSKLARSTLRHIRVQKGAERSDHRGNRRHQSRSRRSYLDLQDQRRGMI